MHTSLQAVKWSQQTRSQMVNGQFPQIYIPDTRVVQILGRDYRIILQSNPPMSVHPII